MINGLDLFSGIGGLSVALSGWVKPMAYCEQDSYCQAVLFSRMLQRELPYAPIWDDVRTLKLPSWATKPDIIYGGFPCQGISVAGLGKGLADERSGLFFEIVRLAKEIEPKFIFLENVPAITSRGGVQVVESLAEVGYDCRWCVISAASIGALHRRERWFLLGYAKHNGRDGTSERRCIETPIHLCEKGKDEASEPQGASSSSMLATEPISNARRIYSSVADPLCERCENWQEKRQIEAESLPIVRDDRDTEGIRLWQETVSTMGRTTDGLPQRLDRIKALGNAVVPRQAKEAFKVLMGLN